MALYTSFGCPFKCSFCCINAPFNQGSTFEPTIRFRDPTNVVDEIETQMQENNVKNVKFIDNYGYNNGGAMYLQNAKNIDLLQIIFLKNQVK